MDIILRPEIRAFAEAMEMEMRRKDYLKIDKHDDNWKWIRAKLIEEREEVDECLEIGNGFKLMCEESLHEGIMLAIMRKYMNNTDPKWKIPRNWSYSTKFHGDGEQ